MQRKPHQQLRRHGAALGLLIWLIVSIAGCSRLAGLTSIDTAPGLSPWDGETYAQFVAENMEELNRRYTRQYAPVEFVVDTAAGSARVQQLIDPAVTALLAETIAEADSDDGRRIDAIMEIIRQRFEYVPEPEIWAPVSETIRAGKGDCKNLSILLLSALAASKIDAFAAVSNGHMWVRAYDGKQWRVLETDHDPERLQIYQIPGFYEDPLYKIFADYSLKRIPRQ